MPTEADLVVRGATIYDGSGGQPFAGDVAITDGIISEIGVCAAGGRSEIDASGLIVTPGFVDIHTHYDGNVTWESRAIPSSGHGVTTIVTGNCGVGFAPVRPCDRDRLVSLMAGVEDIPEVVITNGLSWNWLSFPDYMNAIEGRPHDVDIAVQLPHSALRVFVMGERAVNREDATEADIAEMARLTREALRAGAIGFGTSRSLQHRSMDGIPIPTVRAAEAELLGIAQVLREEGGVFQLLTDFLEGSDVEGEFGLMRRIAETSGQVLFFTLHQKAADPDGWRNLLRLTAEAVADGVQIRPQVIGRPTGVLLGFELTMHPFTDCPSYQPIADLPFEAKVRALREPELRQRLIREAPIDPADRRTQMSRSFSRIFELGAPPNYEPHPSRSLAALALSGETTPEALAYDAMLGDDGRAMLFLAAQDYEYGDLEVTRAMLEDPNTVLGLGDGGAHCGIICDASYPTHMLSYWARDRVRGPKLTLPWVVRALTHDTASAAGLTDRGLLREGLQGDLNLIDFDSLQLGPPQVEYSLPGGGRRLMQSASGYVATIKSGVVTYRDGVHTGELPGRLIRKASSAA